MNAHQLYPWMLNQHSTPQPRCSESHCSPYRRSNPSRSTTITYSNSMASVDGVSRNSQTSDKIYIINIKMEKILLLLATTLLTASIIYMRSGDINDNSNSNNNSNSNKLYQEWKTTHNVVYESNIIDNYRFNIFQENLLRLQENSAEFTTAPNQFMDISADEYQALYLNNFKIPRIKPQNYIR